MLELLVVVLIIGILAAIALPQYNKAVWKTRFVQAKTLAKNIANSEGIYFAAHGQYTDDFTNLDIDLVLDSYSDDKDKANFNWGHCSLVAPETRKEVHCVIYKNGTNYLRYVLDYETNNRLCVAYGENSQPTPYEMSYKVCQ